MKPLVRLASAALLAMLAVAPASAANRVLYLRSSCGTTPDCFTTANSLLLQILNEQTSDPDATILVDVGPGSFTFPAVGGIHDVTFRGSGPKITRLTTTIFSTCDDLHFQDLSITNGVEWRNGSSTWTNVEISGSRYGLWSACTLSPPPDVQIFSSTIETRAENAFHNAAIYLRCGSARIHGSDIRVVGNALSAPSSTTVLGLEVAGTASVEVYGSSIRVPGVGPFDPPFNVAITGTGTNGLAGIRVGNSVGGSAAGGGAFRMHGGIVNVSAQNVTNGSSPIDTAAVLAIEGAPADLSDTAFVVLAGPGRLAHRLRNYTPGSAPANARSPFVWATHDHVPPGDPRSLDGADMYVESACSADACDGGGGETHLMIYNEAACPTQRWFDTSTGRCRGVTP